MKAKNLKKITYIMVAFIILTIGIMVYFLSGKKNSLFLESEFLLATSNYILENNIAIDDEITVSIDLLKKQGFLGSDISCSENSYVKVLNVNDKYEYSASLDCKNISTTITNNVIYMSSNKFKSSVVETILTYSIEKSIIERTNKNVEVRIVASEPVLEVEGWTRINNNTTLVKIFNENIMNETITLISEENNNKYENVSIKVDNIDREKPVVSGVVNNTIYNKDVKIHFYKKNVPLTAKLNNVEITNDYVVSRDGNYNLVVVDDIGNETTVNFKIDSRAPKVNGVNNSGYYNKPVTITYDEGVATLNGENFISGDTVDLENSYQLIVADRAGNKNKIFFTIDMTKPVITDITYNNSSSNLNIFNSDITVKVTYNEPIQILDESWTISSENSNQVYKHFSGVDGIETAINDSVSVIDLAGNKSDLTDVSLVIDKKAPKGVVVATPQTYTNGNVALVLETDEVIIIDNAEDDNIKQYEAGNNRKFITERTENGIFTFSFKDLAGNIGRVSYNVENIDRVKPVITDINYSENLENNISKNNIIVTITYNEDIVPLQDGWNKVTGYDNKITKEFGCLDGTLSDINEDVIVEDFAKNQSEPQNIMFTIDKKKPIGNITADIISPTTSNVILTLTTDEDVTILNSEEDNIEVIEGLHKYFVTITENQTFTFKFKDEAGNVGSTSYDVTNIDRQAPKVLNVEYNNSLTNGRTNADTLVTVSYNEDIVSLDDNWKNVPGKANQISRVFTGLDKKDTLIYELVNVKDLAGNISTPKNISFVIDKTLPTVEYRVKNKTNNDWYNEPIEVEVTGSDSGKSVYKYEYMLVIDGVHQEWKSLAANDENSFKILANSSNVSFIVRSYDEAGNVSLQKVSDIYKIDTIAPEFTYNIQNTITSNNWYNTNLSILVNTNDNLSGVKSLQMSYSADNGATWVDWIDLSVSDNYSNLIIDQEKENLSLKLRVIDNANNINEKVLEDKYTVDKTKPVITVYDGDKANTGDFITYVEADKNGIYSFPKVTVKDNLDNDVELVVTGSPDITKVGAYQVIYSATDKANNSAKLVMNVVVQDTLPPKIKLVGDSPMKLEYGQKYIEYGVIIEDNLDNDLTSIISGDNINVTVSGDYNIIYSVTDSNGNNSSITRLVTVMPTSTTDIVKQLNNCNETGECYINNGTNNYIWYSGFLWRIIKVNDDNTIKLVTEDSVSGFSYDNDSSKFENSIVSDWLNEYFYSSLNNNENIIVTSNYCMDTLLPTQEYSNEAGANAKTAEYAKMNIRYNCDNLYKTKVGLLTIDEYNILGAENSYLNTKDHFFTMTPSTDSTVWVVQTDGIEKAWNLAKNTYSIRPVITISADTKVINGLGTVDNPYRLLGDDVADTNSLLGERYAGEYVQFGNQIWRIVSSLDNSTKLIMDTYYQTENDYAKLKFGNTGDYKESNILQYLNNTVYNDLFTDREKAILVKSEWEYGEYTKGAMPIKYVDSKKSSVQAYVGLISVGELMSGTSSTGRVEGFTSWTMNYINNPTSVSYPWFISWGGTAGYAFNRTDIRGIRPVINLNSNVIISSGTGTFNDPYILEY